MKTVTRTLALLPVLALAGCAVNSYCEGEQTYQKAPTLPPLQATGGVKLPESPSALKIPSPPSNPVAYGEHYQDEDGDDAVRCLDKPPAMPPLAESKPAEAPAVPAPVEAPKPAEAPVPPG